MSSDKRPANAVGGKTARPCDNCLCKRARWYCAADDAFLCQACDSSVHSANPLARRHERLSLKTSGSGSGSLRPEPYPSWIHGFRRKARTPRHSKTSTAKAVAEPPQTPLLVPDLSSGDDALPLDEAHLLYQVPIFDPFIPSVGSNHYEIKPSVLPDYMMEFATCDADLAADVESLLGKGLDDESLSMEALGLMEAGEGEMEWRVKMEEADEAVLDACHVDAGLDLSCDTLDLNFAMETCEDTEEEKKKKKKKKKTIMFLRLDYEAVMMEWARQGSLPWTTGDRPNFDPDDRWPDWTGMCGWENQEQVYEVGGGRQMMVEDRGREARVSRYREKRRSRLFSKKIRYEVRKLNAEKRPRMKGRFVKRASLVGGPVAAAAFPF